MPSCGHDLRAADKNGPATPELCRRCASLHHGSDPQGSTEYKLVARETAPVAGSPRIVIQTAGRKRDSHDRQLTYHAQAPPPRHPTHDPCSAASAASRQTPPQRLSPCRSAAAAPPTAATALVDSGRGTTGLAGRISGLARQPAGQPRRIRHGRKAASNCRARPRRPAGNRFTRLRPRLTRRPSSTTDATRRRNAAPHYQPEQTGLDIKGPHTSPRVTVAGGICHLFLFSPPPALPTRRI